MKQAPASYDGPVILWILRRQGAFLLWSYGNRNFSHCKL